MIIYIYIFFFWILFSIYLFYFFLLLFSKLLMLLTKVTEVTKEHQKWPKVNQKSIKSYFFARRVIKTLAGDQSPRQELEVKPA